MAYLNGCKDDKNHYWVCLCDQRTTVGNNGLWKKRIENVLIFQKGTKMDSKMHLNYCSFCFSDYLPLAYLTLLLSEQSSPIFPYQGKGE